jgi:8-oxo-dGTP pyrophosphatase MutT (NUDIX family)
VNDGATKRFRPSAKGVVVVDGRLLVTRNQTPADPGPDWYIFPGGGQNLGETLEATLVREVREETGIEVVPGPLLWVRELIVALRPDWPFDPGDHVLEFMFAATHVADHGDAHQEDRYQVGVEWVGADDLADLRFYPAAVVPSLREYLDGGSPGPVYLGDTS